MFLIIPSIRLKNGQCSQCIVGNDKTTNYYQELSFAPLNLCRLLRQENSKSLFIIDSDSFLNIDNKLNKQVVIEISKKLEIPIFLHAKKSTIDDYKFYLENSDLRIVLDNIDDLILNETRELIKQYSIHRFAFYYINNFNNDLAKFINDMQFIKNIGFNRITYSDSMIFDNEILNKDYIIERASLSKLKFTIDYNITSAEQLLSLSKLTSYGIDSLILGDALFNNKFPCQKLWRLAEDTLINEVTE